MVVSVLSVFNCTGQDTTRHLIFENIRFIRNIIQYDDGYVISGQTEDFGAGVQDGFVARLDADFNQIWAKTYGGGDEDWMGGSVRTSDGGIITTGFTRSFGGSSKTYYVQKVDQDGNVVWAKTFVNGLGDTSYEVLPLGNGNYLVDGFVNTLGATLGDRLVLELDESGNIINSGRIDCNNANEAGFTLDLTDDGGMIFVGGITGGPSNGVSDIEVVKLDASLSVEWGRAIGGSSEEFYNGFACFAAIEQIPGGYLLATYTESSDMGAEDVLLAKLNNSGNLVWSKAIDTGLMDILYSRKFIKVTDNKYELNFESRDAAITTKRMARIAIDTNGNILESSRFEYAGRTAIYGFQKFGNEYVLTGGTDLGGQNDGQLLTTFDLSDHCGENDFALNENEGTVPTLTSTALTCTSTISTSEFNQSPSSVDFDIGKSVYCSESAPEINAELIVYELITPNQDGDNDYLEIENIDMYPKAVICIYNRWGQEVLRTTNYLNDWDGGGFPDGVYFYYLRVEDKNIELKGSLIIKR